MITWGLVHILQIVQNKKFKQYHTKFGRITAIKPSYLDLCPGGVIFKDIQELLSLYFIPESIHVPCSCNKCAHELAHSGLLQDPDQPIVWFDPLPSFVSLLLDRDLADPDFGE